MPTTQTLQTQAATTIDMFVKIKATSQGLIRGESNAIGHVGEIIALNYQWDLIQPIDRTGSGLASGKRVFGLFRFLMSTQVATPKLLQAASEGEVLSEVTLTCRKAGKDQQEFMIWKFRNALIAKIETGFLSPEMLIPHDEVSLSFRIIDLSYKEQLPDGTLGGGVSYADMFNI